MRLFKILKKPHQTEKTANMEMNNNSYGFIVSPDATKIDIKKAVLDLYGVEVEKVNILNTREKFKHSKTRKMQIRKRASKKAYVTLRNKKDKIDFSIVK